MKKILLLFSLSLILMSFVFSQENKIINKNMMNIEWNKETVVIPCSKFNITKPLREIAEPVKDFKVEKYEFEARESEEGRKAQTFVYSVEEDGKEYGNDPSIIQTELGKSKSKGVSQIWDGQVSAGFRPFDPSGAVGENYYIQMINATTYNIYDKTTGNSVLSGTFGDLWSPATGNEGDPIVLYDKDANRWFMSQFGTENDKNIYIAISKTNDPTGAWYTYTFTSPDFPDYLKFSAWQDGYYMTANYAQKIFAFNRQKMLAGDASAEAVYQSFNPPQQEGGFFVPLPADASDGVMPSAGTPCPIFSYSDNGWGGSNVDAVNIYNASVDWDALTMEVTSAASLPTDAFDSSYDSDWDDIPQPGTSQMLDGIGGAMMYRAQWKKWTDYNSVVLSWAVKISSTQRGIFWCELREDAGNWSIYQQGIFAPGTDYYWMSSMAMNDNGDIALCYAKGSTDTYMSLAYTGRHSDDPLGVMAIGEIVAQAGGGYQTGTNRVGDYAQTCLDPDGVTFWHTGEYLKSGGYGGTKVYSFKLPLECDGPTTQASNISFSNIGDNQITVSWDRGNGDGVIVVAREGSKIDADPSSGTSYNASDVFGSGDIISSGDYVVYNGIGTETTVMGLSTGITYYFEVFEYFNADNCYNIEGITGNETTTGEAPLCYSEGNMDYSTSTTLVSFNTINNSTDKPSAYSDYTDQITDVYIGRAFDLLVNVNTDGDYTVYSNVWIDWNGDNDFDDAEETYDLGSAKNVANGVTSNSPLSVVIPDYAVIGHTLMRVSSKYDVYPSSCDTGFDGEVEEYTVNVLAEVSTESLSKSGINIYPNPTNGEFNVSFSNNFDNANITVVDITGKIVLNKSLTSRFNEIDLSMQTKGIYFIKMNIDGESYISKLTLK